MNANLMSVLFVSYLIIPEASAADNFKGVKETKMHFNLAQFSQIHVAGPFVVSIEESKEQSVTMEGDPQILKLVQVSVKDSVLVVRLEGDHEIASQPRLLVSIPRLISFLQSGSVQAKIAGFSGAGVKFNVRGTGSLNCESEFDRVEIIAHGSSNVNLMSSKIQYADLDIIGNVEVKFPSLKGMRGRIVGGANVSYSSPKSRCDVIVECLGGGAIINRTVDNNVSDQCRE